MFRTEPRPIEIPEAIDHVGVLFVAGANAPSTAQLEEERRRTGRARPELRWNRKQCACFLALCLLPIPAAVLELSLQDHPHKLTTLSWIIYYCALDWLTFGLLVFMANIVLRNAEFITDLLASEEQRLRIRSLLARAALLRWQLTWTLFWALALNITLLILWGETDLSEHMYIGAVSHFQITWTCFILASGWYWMLALVVMAWRISQCDHLAWAEPAPARTPGIEGLARIYRVGALISGFGGLLHTIPLLWVTHVTHPPPDSNALDWAGRVTYALG